MAPAAANDDGRRHGRSRIFNPVAIGHIHVNNTDLGELRRIAELSPDLAHKIADQRLRETENERWRYALGTAVVAGLATMLVAAWRGARKG